MSQVSPSLATPDSKKEKKLFKILRDMKSVLVAFSGGVDSTYLSWAAFQALGKKSLAVTAKSPSLPSYEAREVEGLAAHIGIIHEWAETHEFEKADYRANPDNRCYFCKSSLYETLIPLAKSKDLAAVVNGQNCDDQGDYRPGTEAAKEFKVRSPLLEAGMTKADIRFFSKNAGLPTASRPASACLSSRIPYGEEITREKLERIDLCEGLLRKMGFTGARVRHHEGLARIEFRPEELSRALIPEILSILSTSFRSLGFTYVSVDADGYRTGSLNESLPGRTRSGVDLSPKSR